MLGHLRHLSALIIYFLSFISFASAQNHPTQAEQNPLSTILYLLSTTDKHHEEMEKACLAKSLASVDRFDEVRTVANMVEDSRDFIWIVNGLIARGRSEEASALLSYLLKRDGPDDHKLKYMIEPIIDLKRDGELEPLIQKFDDSDKIDLWLEAAKIYTKLGRSEDARAALGKTVDLALVSKYPEDRAELGLSYAKLGREAETLRFIRLALGQIQWTSGKPDSQDVIDRAVEAYTVLGKDAEARELLERQGKAGEVDQADALISRAQRYETKGDRRKAIETLESALAILNPKEYSDSFDLGNIVDAYVRLGELKKAEDVARSLTGSDYMQQQKLLAIADRYAKKPATRPKAHEILNFALAQADRIDISAEELGIMSSSAKSEQARYQSRIATRLMKLRLDKEALQLIARIKKPYLRASILAEYVAINRNRLPSRKLSSYLEEAVRLLRDSKIELFDLWRYDVFAITARSFAEIGMPARANELFAETLTKLDRYVIDEGIESTLVYMMCNIGVEFDRSKIKADENVKTALRTIIRNWENDEY